MPTCRSATDSASPVWPAPMMSTSCTASPWAAVRAGIHGLAGQPSVSRSSCRRASRVCRPEAGESVKDIRQSQKAREHHVLWCSGKSDAVVSRSAYRRRLSPACTAISQWRLWHLARPLPICGDRHARSGGTARAFLHGCCCRWTGSARGFQAAPAHHARPG